MAPLRADVRRRIVALAGGALLVGGSILGHPDMTVADNCSGVHEVGCIEDDPCDAFCAGLAGAIPCVAVDKCYGVAGLCECKLDP